MTIKICRYCKKLSKAVLVLAMTANGIFAQKINSTAIISLERNEKDNTPTSVMFASTANLHKNDIPAIFREYLGVDGVQTKMVLSSVTAGKRQISTERYEQYYKGIKVAGSSYSVMLKDDAVSFINGNYYKVSGDMSAQPGITEAAALVKALQLVKAEQYIWELPGMEQNLKAQKKDPGATNFPKAELVWIDDHYDQSGSRQLHLAYAFNVYAVKPLSRQMIYVDAQTGAVLHINQLIKDINGTGTSLYSGAVSFKTAILSGVNKLHDTVRGGGINTYSFANTSGGTVLEVTNASSAWTTSAAIDAHWGAEKVYDYWHDVQGRNSFDNMGATLNSYVHYLTNYNNAFWDGSEMVYGDGSGISGGGFSPLTSIDVCAHEIGHAVCQYTADLDYNKESGGMNEGFSDIWGAVIENYANPFESDVVAKNMWVIGEEISASGLRSMSNPNLKGQPDTYGGTYWYNVTGCTPSSSNDQCGVHTNSGVLNHWFYLLSTGGSGTNDLGNAYSVSGIGVADAADIAYQTELSLSSTANYANCRATSIGAAITMYGACSYQVMAVTKAWYAVGVGANYTGATISVITGPGSVCMGSTIALADATSGGSWASSAPGIASVGTATGVVSGITAGTAIISYTVSGGCYATKAITVNPATAIITGTASLCEGQTATLSATAVSGIWTSGNTPVATVGSATGIVSGISGGTATISYAICGTVATRVVTVTGLPLPIAGAALLCAGTSATYASATTGGSWSSSNAGVATVGVSSGIVNAVAAGTSSISYTKTGCSVNAVLTVDAAVSAGTISNGAGSIWTYAGNGTAGYSGDGGDAAASLIYGPVCFTKDITGNIYFADYYNHVIRKVTPSGIISTYAGNGTVGSTGDGGPATAASFNDPNGIAVDAAGNLYIAEYSSSRIRKVNPSGIISTIAGTGSTTYNGDNIPATSANLNTPYGLAVDNSGNLFVAEQYGHRVRKINISGTITTVAGTGTGGYNGDGIQATAAKLYYPNFISTDQYGNLIITDNSNHRIRKVNSAGVITTIAGNGTAAFTGDGGPATAASINFTGGARMDAAGNLYIADALNLRVRKVTAAGMISTIAGTGVSGYSGDYGPATSAKVMEPHDICLDGNGGLLIADITANVIRKVGVYPPLSGGVATLCPGATNSFMSTVAGGTWSSGNISVATVNATGVVLAVATGSAIISYTVTNSCGTAVSTATVNVTSGVDAGTITGPGTVCVGATGSMTASVPGGMWSSGSSAIVAISASGTITGIGAGIATITYAIGTSCGSAFVTSSITVNTLPATGTITGPASVCNGSAISLSNTVTGGVWSSSNTATATVGTTGTVSGVASGTTIISYTTSNAFCNASATLVVTVGSVPVLGPSEVWTVKAPMPVAFVVSGAAAVDSIIYVVGGANSSGITNSVYAYNVHTNIWTAKAPLPAAVGELEVVAVNGKIYAIGGYNGTWAVSSVDEYDPATNAWTAKTSMPVERSQFSAAAIGNKIYVEGGWIGSWPQLDVYDVTTDTWETKASMSFGKIQKSGGAAMGGKFYFLGGKNYYSSEFYDSTAIYDPVSDAWSVGANMPYHRFGGATTVLNHRIYYLGGATGGSYLPNYSNNNYLDSATGTWHPALSLLGKRAAAVAVTVENKIYLIGGKDSADNTVAWTHEYDPEAPAITGALSLCATATTTLTVAATGGVWSSASPGIATVGSSSGIVTGISGGTAVISYTISNSCGSATTTTVVTVNPLPSAGTISGPSTVSIGASVTLSDLVTGGVWSASNSNATVSSGGVVSGIAAGTVVISYTTSNSCGSTSATKVVTVSSSTGSITGTLTVCTGATTTLSSTTPGGVWTSTGTAGIISIGAGTGIVSGLSAGTAIVTYTLAGSPVTAVVTVNQAPAAITGSNSVCLGLTTTLSDATGGGSWSSSNSSIASVAVATGVVTGAAAGTTVISYMLASGCYKTMSFTVKALPAAISGAASLCLGASTTYTDATSGGLSWTSSNTSVATIGASSGLLTGVSVGTVNITYTLIAGCIATKTVSVNNLPSPITGVLTTCVGSTSVLSDSDPGGTWSSSTISVATIGTSGTVTGIAAGVTAIIYSTGVGCNRAVSFTVNPLPAVITGGTSVCAGGTAALSDATTGGTWSAETPSVATVGATGLVTGIAGGTTTVSYTLGTGCARTTVITVSGSLAPNTGMPVTCVGATTALANSTTGGTWSTSNAVVATVSAAGLVTGVSAGTANITYAMSAGCRAVTSVTVNAAMAAITGASSVCIGAATTLSDASAGGVWTSSNTALATVSATGIVTGIAVGTPTISYTLASGCFRIMNVTVKTLPGAIRGALGICAGSTTTLADGTGVSWASSNTAVATIGTTSGIVTGISAGTSIITFTGTTGCIATSVVTVDAAPSVAAITGPGAVAIGGTITLTDATAGGTWSSNNTSVATVSSSGIVTGVAAPATTISYTVTNGACTRSVTKAITITVARTVGSTGGNDGVESPEFGLFPNPTTGAVTVQSANSGLMIVSTLEGREVQRAAISEGTTQFSLPGNLAAGIYICRFQGQSGSVMVRLVYEP